MSSRMRKVLFATPAVLALFAGPVTGNPLQFPLLGGNPNFQFPLPGGNPNLRSPATPSPAVMPSTAKGVANRPVLNFSPGSWFSFLQPGSGTVVSNPATGVTSSRSNSFLFGTGNSFLFGTGTGIDTAGAATTTGDTGSSDVGSGKFATWGRSDATSLGFGNGNANGNGNGNGYGYGYGNITANGGGLAALVAPGAGDSGTIGATVGTAASGASSGVTLDFYGDRLISLAVGDSAASSVKDVATGQPLTSLVAGNGKRRPNGGHVELTVGAARQLVDSVVNNNGVVEARSVGRRNGLIVLGAATDKAKSGAATSTALHSATTPAAGGGQTSGSSSGSSGTAPGGPPGGQAQHPAIGDRNFSGVPPRNETRFAADEVMIQLGAGVSPRELQTIAQRFDLAIVTSESLSIVGRTLARLRITNGRPVPEVIRALEAARLPIVVTPNYRFALVLDTATPVPSSGSAGARADQYVVDTLHLGQAHGLSRGDDVLIAMIDSGVDAGHPDLAGTIRDRFDVQGTAGSAHPHGTGMAGAIASHQQLLGVAPAAKLLTVRAFAPGSTDAILKGLDWAVRKGARIINMSFAGPFDPMLQEALARASASDVLLVAAAGNAGPKSPPLYPGADPHVIAVTATDGEDNLFAEASRGRHVSIAAPGVGVLVPAPDATYQLTTGTSVAAAHVSGVAALLMSRNPNADAATIRAILQSTARDLGPKGRDDQFGWGLVDPLAALTSLDALAAR
ncbi:MAG: S8 family serine peptidase [Xanthobacteraceae bacterium]